MTDEPDLAPHFLPLYAVFYDPAAEGDEDDMDAWEVGLEDGFPIAICFSDEDANTVADALNMARLVPIGDDALLTAYRQTDGESGIACALLAEIQRRRLNV